jgi:ribose transport system permease protein
VTIDDGVRRLFTRHGKTLLIYGLLVALSVVATIVNPAFAEPRNLFSVLRQAIPLSLVAIGQTFVVLTGGIDFTTGAVAGLVAVSVATVVAGDPSLIAAGVALAIVIGLVAGSLAGGLVAMVRAMPFIVTFGVAGVLVGITLTIADGPTGRVPLEFLAIYDARLGDLPVSVIAVAGIWAVSWIVLARTRFGRHIYAVGGNTETARLAGIPVGRILASAYVVSGVMASLAGLFLLARSGVGDPTFGAGFDFLSITAVTVGGVSLYGGTGSLLGTLGGVLLLTFISNIFNITQVDIFYQQLLTGAIILVAVALYRPRLIGRESNV